MRSEASSADVRDPRRRLLCAGAVGWAVASLLPAASAWDLARLQAEMQRQAGPPGLRRLEAWQQMLARQQSAVPMQQLRAVNEFWNSTVLASTDKQAWLAADYWATPLQTLAKGQGDCEDFVIGKYFSLIRLGMPYQQMRFVYVRAKVAGQSVAHMVLGFYETPQAEPLVLDNLVGDIYRASQRTDLAPVFSFDAKSVYVSGAAASSVSRINRWQDLLVRMRQEGFDV